MKRLVALVVLLAAACAPLPTASQSSPTTQSQASSAEATSHTAGTSPVPTGAAGGGSGAGQPSPAAVPSPAASKGSEFAVLVDLFAATGSYDITIVGADAKVVARAHAAKRTVIADAAELPYVSTSNSRVYYLDGDSQVRFLTAQGATGLVTSVAGDATVHATFAVTPDDQRIAVALLDYGVSPVQLKLYVEDLGGAHHAEIFTSNSHYVWPVGWHSGQLVVGYLGPGSAPFNSKMVTYSSRDKSLYPYGPNPYGVINFHVIDPVTAERKAIISGGGASGLLSKAGAAIVQGGMVDWNGAYGWNFPNGYGSYSAAASLSPDGQMIAACCEQPESSGHLVIWYPNLSSTVLPATLTSGDWAGWFDSHRLITGFSQRTDGTPTVVDINTGWVMAADAHGIVAAMLPGGLDPQ